MSTFSSTGASHQQRSLGATFITILCIIPLVLSASIRPQFNRRHIQRSIETVSNISVGLGDSAKIYPTASSYWYASIEKRGAAAFNENPTSYKVFRNVLDYGAKGDGVNDDTAAINAAIQDGGRCGNATCDSSTITPAVIYFPAGTYMISAPIIAWYYSQLVGDPLNRPTIKGVPNFVGIGLIDSDPYLPSGANWYTNQNNFFRAIRNFVIDTTAMELNDATGIHWQVAQATSLINIHFEGSKDPSMNHQGIFMDNGSGGFMSDLSFNGGGKCAMFGNQQFMTRNMTFTNCKTAIFMNWNWQWTFKSVTIDNCGVGINMSNIDPLTAMQTVGSIIMLDSSISNTPVGVETVRTVSSLAVSGGSLVLDNVQFKNVETAVCNPTTGEVILPGSTGEFTIDLWGQGRDYSSGTTGAAVQETLTRAIPKPEALLTLGGNTIFERSRPLYEDVDVSNFVSVKACGAKGDGTTDDTAALQEIFKKYANSGKIIYFDHGVYVVSSTVHVCTGTRMVGEAWAVIMADGDAFKDVNNPTPVFQIGSPGESGMVEMSELLFETRGPQVGAILLEWNSRDPVGCQGLNGMWDVHFRVGGSAGTELTTAECKAVEVNPSAITTPNPACYAAFMLMHIGKTGSVYMENIWGWTSDHALDRPFDRITIYNARGIFTESTEGPNWMYAVASEHNVLYQYQMQDTKNLFMAVGQSETPYFQSNPIVTAVHPANTIFNDPTYSTCTTDLCKKSLGLRIVDSSDIHVYGAGFYSFFENYSQNCTKTGFCQENMVSIENSHCISLLNLNTVAVENMAHVDGVVIAKGADNINNFASTVMRIDVV